MLNRFRGKSTLINALLGAELLPTAVVPLTSVVTILGFGPAPAATVEFTDGRETTIEPAHLADFITERGNPNNEKGVAQVYVSFPADLLRDGVRLIDTPGVGSVYKSNTEITYLFLPQADAAIFLISADQPISQDELDFLHEARRYAAKFLFVQNKIDYLNEAERRESLEFSREIISKSIGLANVEIYQLSAKQALQA